MSKRLSRNYFSACETKERCMSNIHLNAVVLCITTIETCVGAVIMEMLMEDHGNADGVCITEKWPGRPLHVNH
jgi:hypothetical protein